MKYSPLNWPIILHILTKGYNQLPYCLFLCNWNAKHSLKQKHLFKDAHVPSLKSGSLIFDLHYFENYTQRHAITLVCCMDSFSLFLVCGFTVKANVFLQGNLFY